MKKYITNALKFLVFISLGIFIFWKVYQDQDWKEILEALHEVNFLWVYVSIFLGIISHLARSARWVLLADSLGYKPSHYNSFFAVMIGYFANLAFPRMGEVTRGAIIKQYEKIPLSTAFGTIITERIIDLIMLVGITGLAILLQFDVFQKFVLENPAVSENIQSILESGWVIGIAAFLGLGAVVIYFLFRQKFEHIKIISKINEKVNTLKDGLLSIKDVKNKLLFILFTFTIWIAYYGMLYVCFFSFPFMDGYGPVVALTIFVLGSYGMVAPVQGGIGAYHFMVISGLVIYGVGGDDAKLFALVVWSAQTLMLIGMGLISYISLPFYNRYKKRNHEPAGNHK